MGVDGQGRTRDSVQGRQAEGLPGEVGEAVFDLQSQLQGETEPLGFLDLPAKGLARGAVEEFAGERAADLQQEGMERGGRGGRARRRGVPKLGVLGQVAVAGAVQVPEAELRPVAQALGRMLRRWRPIL